MVLSKVVSWKVEARIAFRSSVQGIGLLFVAIIGLSFAASPAFAAGGSCPTSSSYTIQGGSPGTLSSAGITSCFYISKSLGSDSNNGTSESTPWAHLPGMPSCTGQCSSTTLAAGEGFILRGGDSWGNSDLGVQWSRGGTSSNPIYIGVDPNWPSSGWTRPIFNCGGSVCSGGQSGNYIAVNGPAYVTVDNIEMTDLDWTGGQKSNDFVYGLATNLEVEHMYMHGWVTHSPSYDASGLFMDSSNGNSAIAGCKFHDNIVDGSDTSNNGFTGVSNCEQVYNNYVSHVHVCYFIDMNIVHDNVCEDIAISVTGDHANGFALFGPLRGTDVLFYNNIVRHTSGCSGCVNTYLFQLTGANSAYQLFYFNNVFYDLNASNVIDLGGSGAGGNYGTWYLFNNTGECGSDSSTTQCYNGNSAVSMTLFDTNNHWISSSTSGCSNKGVGGTCTATNSLTENVSQASAAGYKSSQTYAFSPTSSSSPTVGAGSNEVSGYCSTISGINSAAGAACTNSTSVGCAYNTTNHTLTCPNETLVGRPTSTALDIGAYQFNSGNALPNPPSGLSAVVN